MTSKTSITPDEYCTVLELLLERRWAPCRRRQAAREELQTEYSAKMQAINAKFAQEIAELRCRQHDSINFSEREFQNKVAELERERLVSQELCLSWKLQSLEALISQYQVEVEDPPIIDTGLSIEITERFSYYFKDIVNGHILSVHESIPAGPPPPLPQTPQNAPPGLPLPPGLSLPNQDPVMKRLPHARRSQVRFRRPVSVGELHTLQAEVSCRFFWDMTEPVEGVKQWIESNGYDFSWTEEKMTELIYLLLYLIEEAAEGRLVPTGGANYYLREGLRIDNIHISRISGGYLFYPVEDSLPQWNKTDFSREEQRYVDDWAPGLYWPLSPPAFISISDSEWQPETPAGDNNNIRHIWQ